MPADLLRAGMAWEPDPLTIEVVVVADPPMTGMAVVTLVMVRDLSNLSLSNILFLIH